MTTKTEWPIQHYILIAPKEFQKAGCNTEIVNEQMRQMAFTLVIKMPRAESSFHIMSH